MNKSVKYGLTVFVILIIIHQLNMFFKVRSQYRNSMYKEIDEITVEITKYITVYNNGKPIDLDLYKLKKYDELEVGDVLFKNECDDKLLILRLNEKTGKYETYKTFFAREYFWSTEWFDCK